MNRPIQLHIVLIEELFSQHSLTASRDVETFLHRVKHEGNSFAAITLPELGSHFEWGLENGFFPASRCTAFKRNNEGTLPRFCEGLLLKVFDKRGRLLPEPDVDAIYALRQIFGFAKKPKALCSEERILRTYRNFRRTEEDLRSFTERCSAEDPVLRQVSSILWAGEIFSDLTPERLVCRHGPGATSERKSSNSRWEITHWNERGSDLFPLELHALVNFGHYRDLEGIELLDEGSEMPVRVISVPKTLKAPRIIAIEPSHVQFMQQGLMRYVVPILESHELTRNSVHFTVQAINQDGARRASVNRDRATLDLSEASDRVHNELVRNIFRGSPILPYLQACRSTRALLPDRKALLSLTKYASMGSAMCFPVEAMVFYTVIQCALHYYHGEKPTHDSVRRFSRLIDVYGDDLIVPSYAAVVVRKALEAFGLLVNSKKSFVKGDFRESCGGDYYKGQDVSPVYLRCDIPSGPKDRCDPTVLVSLAATSDQLYKKGLWKTCQLLRDWVQSLKRGRIYRSPYAGGGLFFLSAIFTTGLRYCADLHQYVQRRLVMSPVRKRDATSDKGKLLQALTPRIESHMPFGCVPFDGSALDFDQSVKRGAFKTKHRMVAATIGSKLV